MFITRSLRSRTLCSPFYTSFHSSPAWSRKVIQKFKLADIGEGITECEIIKWSIGPSSPIQSFDPLCEVQSDKASVEITSPFDGVVKELLVAEGQIAKVGEGLCLIEVEEEEAQETEETAASPHPHPEQEAEELRVEDTAESPEPASQPPKRRPHPLDPSKTDEAAVSSSLSDSVLATPSVRHYARKNGVDLSLIAPGSGKGGRIERKDVEAALSGNASASEPLQAVVLKNLDHGHDIVVELGRTRYGMWKAMTKSLEIPHFGYSTTLDLTPIHDLLPILNSNIPTHYLPASTPPPPPLPVSPSAIFPAPSPPPVPESGRFARLTYLPVLLKTLSRAMVEWPLFRSSITPDSASSAKPTLTVRPHADIAIALSTPTGLYTPTLQRVNTHSIYELASQIRHISHLGRQTPSGLTPAEMPKRGATITVSNVGAIGAGDYAMPVLVPGGGVAIVAIGRAKWVRDEERSGERRLKVGVSWSADHRVVEGAELAAFVECWRSWAEVPERLVGEAI